MDEFQQGQTDDEEEFDDEIEELEDGEEGDENTPSDYSYEAESIYEALPSGGYGQEVGYNDYGDEFTQDQSHRPYTNVTGDGQTPRQDESAKKYSSGYTQGDEFTQDQSHQAYTNMTGSSSDEDEEEHNSRTEEEEQEDDLEAEAEHKDADDEQQTPASAGSVESGSKGDPGAVTLAKIKKLLAKAKKYKLPQIQAAVRVIEAAVKAAEFMGVEENSESLVLNNGIVKPAFNLVYKAVEKLP